MIKIDYSSSCDRLSKNYRVTTYNYRKHRYLLGDYSVWLLGIKQQFITAKRPLQKRFRMF
ncbi:hypothetical protein [[Scytonema hofmanni] UTEX B 1581]|uniref:hypothetical protein n=1 Tax=[Scytonema hofmanni] UTEX B 1581 TaxID=379535 RepID=UPI0004BA3AE8|nr:hypothetical protein [[Scytonema hofmanni] UTEX B 1581]